MTTRCSFTGPGWYRMLWRSFRDLPGATRDVWIEDLNDPDHPGFVGVWHRPAVAGDPPILLARMSLAMCERNLVQRERA